MILDTNALSAFADGNPKLGALLETGSRHEIPAIVLGEYRYGLTRSRERAARERWLHQIEEDFLVLPVTSETSRHYAAVRHELREAGNPIPENDVWIAALCRETGLQLISRDRHFDKVEKLKRLEW